MKLNFDFGSNTVNRKSQNIISLIQGDKIDSSRITTEVVQQTPFDQDERFSLIKAELSFVDIKDKLVLMRKNAVDIDVKDAISNKTAMEMLVQCKALIKKADKAKQGIPAYSAAAKFKSGVDTFIREQLKKPIEKIERLINPKIGSYQKGQAELQRRIAQKAAQEEAKRVAEMAKKAEEIAQKEHEQKMKDAEELQKQLNEEADKAGVDRVQVDVPEFEASEIIAPSEIAPIVKQTEKVITTQGTNTIKSKWVCIVEDADKVPREYCQPDQKALDIAVENGIRSINGCKIEEIFEAKVRMSSSRKSIGQW